MPQPITDLAILGPANGHNGLPSNGDDATRHGRDALAYDGSQGFVPLWQGSQVDRREFVRLALQAFEEMGYACVPPPPTTAAYR